jgi:hypothetical protein
MLWITSTAFSDGLIKKEKSEQETLQFSSWWPICFYHFQNGVEWILVVQSTPQHKLSETPDCDVLLLMQFSPQFPHFMCACRLLD